MIYAMLDSTLDSAGVATESALTVDELAQRVGMSVRNVRFYASRGLIPPPHRRGRVGFYGPDHVVRLELVRELQAHGFTLNAIEGYLERIPADASPQDVALHRTLLAPWMPDLPETVSRIELVKRCGRALSDSDISTLMALGVVAKAGPGDPDGSYRVAPAMLGVGVEMLDLGLPKKSVRAAHDVFTAHGRAIAEELTEIFRTQVWPLYRESGESRERIRELVERFKPITVQALVIAYERAVNETKRATVRRSASRRATSRPT
jgi:DNA-binding transcriptional MerR regulator